MLAGAFGSYCDSGAKLILCSPDQAERMPGDLVDEILLLDDSLLAGADDHFDTLDTAADDPAQLYYSSGTTGLAKGILHAHRYLLAHEEFVYCHDVRDGELFHGMGEWAWAAGIAPLLGPWRLGATFCAASWSSRTSTVPSGNRPVLRKAAYDSGRR